MMNMFKMNGEIMGKIREYDNLSKDELITMLINHELTQKDIDNQFNYKINGLNRLNDNLSNKIDYLQSKIDKLENELSEWKEFHYKTVNAKELDIDLLIDKNSVLLDKIVEKNHQIELKDEEINRLNNLIVDTELAYDLIIDKERHEWVLSCKEEEDILSDFEDDPDFLDEYFDYFDEDLDYSDEI